MRDIKEYGAGTSAYELLDHLSERILSGDLKTFPSLMDYLSPIPKEARSTAVIKRCFELQKRLYWGFFKDISRETHPSVWREIVIPDRTCIFAGELKRDMTIPSIFLALIDIHGYTKYCHDCRNNLSMLAMLDGMLQDDVPKIATKLGVVSRRARGDELLLAGASASEVLEAVLTVTDYLGGGRKRREAIESAGAKLPSDRNLPTFTIAAGIAGGQKYSSLIITRDGDLSGDIVNMAARLQSRAGKISPKSNKVLITGTVCQKLKSGEEPPLRDVDFFNTGIVEFKGLSVGVYDIVFLPEESHRMSYLPVMESLYDSIAKGLWKGKVFHDALDLASGIVQGRNPRLVRPNPEANGRNFDTVGFLDLIKQARQLFEGERFDLAVQTLGQVAGNLSEIEGIDELAHEYIEAVQSHYGRIVATFEEWIDREVDNRLESIFGIKERENYLLLKRNHESFIRLRETARLKPAQRKVIWQRVADETAKSINIKIQSRK